MTLGVRSISVRVDNEFLRFPLECPSIDITPTRTLDDDIIHAVTTYMYLAIIHTRLQSSRRVENLHTIFGDRFREVAVTPAGIA